MASAIGTAMTQFALTIWAWQLTQEATAIALISFFFQLPQILIALFAGLIVDRFNRKYLMIFSDTSVALCTLVIGVLYATHNLHVWHLYGLAAAYGCFGQIQTLAYSASIALMVPKQHYTRASSMSSLVNYSSAIVAPALVGSLYAAIGFMGVILIDLATFAAGISTLWWVQIPQPSPTDTAKPDNQTIGQQLSWGIRYILFRPSLLSMTVVFCCFLFAHHLGEALYQPLILARTGGNVQVLGTVVAAAGVGGVIGGLSLTIFGGFRRKVRGMLIGFIGVGLGEIVLGIGQTPIVWIGAQLFSAFNIPLSFSSSYAVWYAKVEPALQGRVLAAAHTLGLLTGAIASLIAGPLADRVFEPMMNSQGIVSSAFAPLVGTGAGAGMALLYIITAVGMILIGVIGFAFPTLRNAEELLPDHDHEVHPVSN
jgi:DHA3 family macrolide efflux protein-like MFS transporter